MESKFPTGGQGFLMKFRDYRNKLGGVRHFIFDVVEVQEQEMLVGVGLVCALSEYEQSRIADVRSLRMNYPAYCAGGVFRQGCVNSSCAFKFSLSHPLSHIGGIDLREERKNDVTAKQCNMSPNFQEVAFVASVW